MTDRKKKQNISHFIACSAKNRENENTFDNNHLEITFSGEREKKVSEEFHLQLLDDMTLSTISDCISFSIAQKINRFIFLTPLNHKTTIPHETNRNSQRFSELAETLYGS